MAVDVDWRLARREQPNVFANFTQGMEWGQGQQDRRERRNAYDQLGKDPQAAQRGLMKAGDYRGADMVGDEQDAQRTQQAAMAKERAAGMLRILQGLQQVPAGQRLAALHQNAQMFQELGIDPGALADSTEEELSDESLSLLTGKVAQAAEEYTLPPGAKRFKGDKLVADNPAAPPRPTIVPQGGTVLGPDGKPTYTAPKTFAPRQPRGGGKRTAEEMSDAELAAIAGVSIGGKR